MTVPSSVGGTQPNRGQRNWARNVQYQARSIARPHSIDELSEVVAAASEVRALGTRHTFNAIADTRGVLVETSGLPEAFELNHDRRVVRVSASSRYADVAQYLQNQQLALHNLGSLPHISVAGAVSTGTHGSGIGNGNLATAVRGVRIVGADGTSRWVRGEDASFQGSIVALGLLGVVVELELAVQPTYLVRQDVYVGGKWETLLADPDAVLGAGYSVSVFTNWANDEIGQIWAKRRVETHQDQPPIHIAGATRIVNRQVPLFEGGDNTTRQGEVGPWSAHLPHFRVDRIPSVGAEIQSEYFVARSDAADALAAIRRIGDVIRPVLHVSELRTVAADSFWLSGAYARESLAIHFTWRDNISEVEEACRVVEHALEPFQPRPHWGKLHGVSVQDVASKYPRLTDFRDLIHSSDPNEKFMTRDVWLAELFR